MSGKKAEQISIKVEVCVGLAEDIARTRFVQTLRDPVPSIIAAKLWRPATISSVTLFGPEEIPYPPLATETAIILEISGECPQLPEATGFIVSALRTELLFLVRRGQIGIYRKDETGPTHLADEKGRLAIF